MCWLAGRTGQEIASGLALVLVAFLIWRIWRGLATGVIANRWPYPPLERRRAPGPFWVNLGVYAAIALVFLVVSVMTLIGDLGPAAS